MNISLKNIMKEEKSLTGAARGVGEENVCVNARFSELSESMLTIMEDKKITRSLLRERFGVY